MWNDEAVVTPYRRRDPPGGRMSWFNLAPFAAACGRSSVMATGSPGKGSQRFVGEVGFLGFQARHESGPVRPGLRRDGPFNRDFGKGYAAEAVGAIHDWLDEKIVRVRFELHHRPDNIASRRVAEKSGLMISGCEALYRDNRSNVYRREGVTAT